jgi:hypothetical protein
MSHWGWNDTCVVFVSLRIIRKDFITRAHARTHTHNLTRFPVLVVLENNGLSKAAVCMQKFHVATVKVFSTNATKHTGEMELQRHPFLTPVLGGSERSASCPERFNLRYKFNRKLGGPQSRYAHFGLDKYTLPLQRLEFRIVQSLA